MKGQKGSKFPKRTLGKRGVRKFFKKKKKKNKISGETLIRDLKVPRPEFILIDLTELILN